MTINDNVQLISFDEDDQTEIYHPASDVIDQTTTSEASESLIEMLTDEMNDPTPTLGNGQTTQTARLDTTAQNEPSQPSPYICNTIDNSTKDPTFKLPVYSVPVSDRVTTSMTKQQENILPVRTQDNHPTPPTSWISAPASKDRRFSPNIPISTARYTSKPSNTSHNKKVGDQGPRRK